MTRGSKAYKEYYRSICNDMLDDSQGNDKKVAAYAKRFGVNVKLRTSSGDYAEAVDDMIKRAAKKIADKAMQDGEIVEPDVLDYDCTDKKERIRYIRKMRDIFIKMSKEDIIAFGKLYGFTCHSGRIENMADNLARRMADSKFHSSDLLKDNSGYEIVLTIEPDAEEDVADMLTDLRAATRDNNCVKDIILRPIIS